jgi:hypothetical protein
MKGEPGTRKSTAALSYPLPQYWISTDRKMNALALPASKWGIDMNQIDFDDYIDYDAPRVKLELFETKCRYKTIILDSITSIGDAMNRQVQKRKGANAYMIGGIPVDTIEDYKAEASAFRETIALLNSIRKYHHIHVVIIAHVVGQRSNNDANKLTHHSRVIVTGGDKISAKISSYVDEAYHFNIKPGPSESSAGDYTCITAHSGNDYARTSLELPREIVFNDKQLYKEWIAPAISKMKGLKPQPKQVEPINAKV